MSPDFDELVGTEGTGAERARLREAHDLLLRAGPPPELTPKLKAGPNPGVARMQHRRRKVKRRALVLLAAALSVAIVFFAGYTVSSHRNGGASSAIVKTIALKGTPAVHGAQATLDVWRQRDGNWPMTLDVKGLPKLPAHIYYEVYLVRGGRPWGSCGTFVVTDPSRVVKVSLNAPYQLQKGDTWVVTRQTPGSEPGRTVLRPVSA